MAHCSDIERRCLIRAKRPLWDPVLHFFKKCKDICKFQAAATADEVLHLFVVTAQLWYSCSRHQGRNKPPRQRLGLLINSAASNGPGYFLIYQKPKDKALKALPGEPSPQAGGGNEDGHDHEGRKHQPADHPRPQGHSECPSQPSTQGRHSSCVQTPNEKIQATKNIVV